MAEIVHSGTLSSSAQETINPQKLLKCSHLGNFFLQNANDFQFYLVILHPISKNSYFLWYIISLKGSG